MAVQGLIAEQWTVWRCAAGIVEWIGKKQILIKYFWRELVDKLVEVLADGKVTFNEALALAMIIYSEIKNKNHVILLVQRWSWNHEGY